MSFLDEIDFVVEPFEGGVYRMHNHESAFAPLSGEGARLFGGRFNIEGESALYTATDQKTAFMRLVIVQLHLVYYRNATFLAIK